MSKGKGKKKGKKVRVEFRPNRNQPARDKSWTRQYHEHGFKNSDTVSRESLKPKGELSRKRTVIEDADTSGLDLQDGTVVAMRGLYVDVDDGQRLWPCTVRRILKTRLIEERHPVTVGDRVQFIIESDEEGLERAGVIYNVYDRVSQLSRGYAKRRHVIVANVDQVLIVASTAQPPLKPHLIDRYLVSAHAGKIRPLICINKVDLGLSDETRAVTQIYQRIGYDVIHSSAVSRDGLDTLRELFCDCITAIVGQSGVGKSSLLNAIQPGLQLAIGEVSDATSKGTHTTTTAQLLKLAGGGYVVDTPGVKSYELAVVPKNEYELHFVEFADHVPHCKFPDCIHVHEQGCAIKRALDSGDIDQRRYDSYVRMIEEEQPE